MEKIRVLFAEDELSLAIITKESLEYKNFEVTHVVDGKKALDNYRENLFDILVFDVMMPELDGFSLTQKIRQIDKKVPIILLTSKSQSTDVVFGFNCGANDYLKKPFSIEELIVRMQALIGRQMDQEKTSVIKFGQYTLDIQKQQLQCNKENHSLTFMETELLVMLIENAGQIVDKSMILNKIWGRDTFFNGRSLDVFITKLRKKLSADSKIQIINSKGHGYKIVF